MKGKHRLVALTDQLDSHHTLEILSGPEGPFTPASILR